MSDARACRGGTLAAPSALMHSSPSLAEECGDIRIAGCRARSRIFFLRRVDVARAAQRRRARRDSPRMSDAASDRQPVGRRGAVRPVHGDRALPVHRGRVRLHPGKARGRARAHAVAFFASERAGVADLRARGGEVGGARARAGARPREHRPGHGGLHRPPRARRAAARAERHRRGDGAHAPLPAAGVAGGRRRARRVARAAGAVRLPRSGRAVQRRDVAEHPRGVGDGPPPLPRGGRAAARAISLTEATLEPLLASSHAVDLLLPKSTFGARERGAGLPHAAAPRARRRVPDGRVREPRPARRQLGRGAVGARLPRARRCCRTRRSASRTPRSTPRSPPSSRSGCSSTPTRRCPSPTARRASRCSAAAATAPPRPPAPMSCPG